MKAIIEAKNLTKYYKEKKALDNVSLTIEKGTVFGILGLNGAGKSTLIECMLGTKKKDNGTISILGLDPVKDRIKLFERVGVQFQDCAYPNLITVKELCEMSEAVYVRHKSYKDLLNQLGLATKLKNKVSSLSGGERQRLFIALALLPDPEIVFLDELTSGLDTYARKEIRNYLLSLKGSLTILLSSHYMDEVEKLCDKIAILKKGKKVFDGTIEEAKNLSNQLDLENAYEWFCVEENIL